MPLPTPRPTQVPTNTAGRRAETITTSLGQQVDAIVAGFDDSPLRFDQLVLAIDEGERLLGVPYPSPNVTMRRVVEVTGGFCGNNQMSYATGYVGDPYVVDGSVISVRVDEDCNDTFGTIAHEVAHSWFFGNDPADWIDEGLANAIEHQIVVAYDLDKVVYSPVTYCDGYDNIGELERDAPAKVSKKQYTGFSCNYTLGDGIFSGLREYFGDDEFNRRIAQLARHGASDTIREQSVTDLRKVIGGDGLALHIIDLWYVGQPQMRLYSHLDAVTWTFPPTIDGEYLHFAGKIAPADAIHDFVLGDDPFCSQFSLHKGIADQEWVNNVSRPLLAGRTHHEDSKVITINHHINQSTGEFRITARILDNALAGIRDLSILVDERVTTGVDGLCQESVNYSQVSVVAGNIPTELKESRFLHLDAIQWTFPPTIDGEYLHFAGKTNEPGLVHEFVLGNDPYCSQFDLYRNVVNQEWVTGVSDPLLVGWQHSGIPQVVVLSDKIDPESGEFSVTAMINDPELAGIQDLSLLVGSRVESGSDNTCSGSDSYSQLSVSLGEIPNELKTPKHYHHNENAIQWTSPPTISGNQLKFSGKAEPGAIGFEWREGHCSQFSFYERDELGYHYIDSLSMFLPGNRSWTGPITAEITNYHIGGDGAFKTTALITENTLDGYNNPVFVVRTLAAVDQATRKCGTSVVLSAIDIQGH